MSAEYCSGVFTQYSGVGTFDSIWQCSVVFVRIHFWFIYMS